MSIALLGSIAEDLMKIRPGRIAITFITVMVVLTYFSFDVCYWIELSKRKKRMKLKKAPHRRGWGIPSKTSRKRVNLILYVFFLLWGFIFLHLFLNAVFSETWIP